MAEIVGIPLENSESLQVVHYAASEQYLPHCDAWDADTELGKRCMARGGQRLVTCLLHLNDVEQGGGTSFPKLDMEVRPKNSGYCCFTTVIQYQKASLRQFARRHAGVEGRVVGVQYLVP